MITNLTLKGHSQFSRILSKETTWGNCEFTQIIFLDLERNAFKDCVFRDCFITPGNSFFAECVFINCNELVFSMPTFLNCIQKDPVDEIALMAKMLVS